MTNPLEDMKAVYLGKIYALSSVYLHSDKVELVDVFNSNKDGDICQIVNLSDIKPLLKFPDKDSEGNDCWSGDLFEDSEDDLLMLFHNGWRWYYTRPEWVNDDEREEACGGFADQEGKGFLEGLIRKCHIYDKEALDYLPEDVITKLKGEV